MYKELYNWYMKASQQFLQCFGDTGPTDALPHQMLSL